MRGLRRLIAGALGIGLAFTDPAAFEAPDLAPRKWTGLGLGEPIFENSFPIYGRDGAVTQPGLDAETQIRTILALKPAIVRLWVPLGFFLHAVPGPDGTAAPLAENIARMRAITSAFRAAGVAILGVDHSFPSWMTGVATLMCAGADTNWNAIPTRDLAAGSRYQQFLNRLEASWAALAGLFPEIASWEPANETNGANSLTPEAMGNGCPSGTRGQFSYADRVLITLDIMAKAHAGIRRGNPRALVITPPPAPVSQADPTVPARNIGSIGNFFAELYRGIAAGTSVTGSRDRRDYFDGVSWHPYIFADATHMNWVRPNEEIREVLVRHGDGALPVILSEVGNSDVNWSNERHGLVPVAEDVLAGWMRNTLTLTRERLPWVRYLIWFRAFDSDRAVAWGGEHQRRFGIFTTPSAPTTRFVPKPSSDVFCAFTGCAGMTNRP